MVPSRHHLPSEQSLVVKVRGSATCSRQRTQTVKPDPPGPQRGCDPAACGAERTSLPSDGLCRGPGAGLRFVQVTLLTPPRSLHGEDPLLLHRAGPGSERAGIWLKVIQLIPDRWVLGQYCESKPCSLVSTGQFFLLYMDMPIPKSLTPTLTVRCAG